MHFLGRFRIAQKLALAFGLVLSFCALLGVVSLYQLSLINQQLNLVANEDNKKLKMLDDLRFQLSTLRRGELTRTLVTSPATLQMLYNALDADIKKFAVQRSEYSSLHLSSEEAQLNRDLNDASNAFASHFLEAMELQKADRADEARLEVVTKGRGLCDAAAVAIAKSQEHARNSAEARAKKAASDYLVARTEIMMLLAIVLATGIAFSIMITRGITKPLHLTEKVLQGLARGDLTNRAEVDSDDEAGAMSRSLNQTVESLRDMLASIASHGNRLATAVEEISATSNETSQNARTQSDQAELVATSMHEMSATVVEVSENSRRAANAASTACETARNGGHIVNEALVSMHAISASTETVAARIAELGKGSERIGVIAAVIDDIADQTNLLALNAAIEAARAGEQGRGFAVVADEVRKLAERTTAATKEIASMIEGIQKEAKEAVVAMEKGSAAVELGVQKTEASGKALEKIIEMASNVGDMVTQIATASSEQAATTEDVNKNISNIASMSGASSKSAEQTSSACSELSSLAIELQGIIGRFKLSVDEEKTSSRAERTTLLPFASRGNLARDSQAGGRFVQ